ncbi:MAG: hydrogenase subunit MbhD domain-containing protein [Synergistaceae bacterium]|nr:hydrogenase subunit MbhD domain-containing protein [Synergistaceae bacterium]
MIDLMHTAVLIMLLLSAFFVLWLKELIASAIALAAFSLTLAVEFYILQAPDVAIAEAAIGAALSTTIFIIAIRACSTVRKIQGDGRK